jgi:hypothetical protein
MPTTERRRPPIAPCLVWTTTIMDGTPYDDDPERVREHLLRTVPGDWFVFETFAADGSLAVGIAHGAPDPRQIMVVYESLSKTEAEAAAQGLARWHRAQGRNIAIS